MILLNFSHPVTETQRLEIEALTSTAITRLLELHPQFDEQQPFPPQLATLLAQLNLTATEWQSEPLLVMLPSLNFIASLSPA